MEGVGEGKLDPLESPRSARGELEFAFSVIGTLGDVTCDATRRLN